MLQKRIVRDEEVVVLLIVEHIIVDHCPKQMKNSSFSFWEQIWNRRPPPTS
jgi:hypothetical protein